MDYQETIKHFENKLNTGASRNRRRHYETAISAMKELKEYKQIGTPKQIREAVERNFKKKAKDARGDKLKFCTCPTCGKRISNVEGGNYCQNCGQRIWWG